MESFDDSGDGALQIEEFVTLEKFRNTLEALAREEKQIALEEAKLAKIEEEKATAIKKEVKRRADAKVTRLLFGLERVCAMAHVSQARAPL